MQHLPILLVEDNVDDEELTLRSLKQCNLANEIIVARDGVAAIELLHGTEANGGVAMLRPAVVILDLKLPKLDGLGVLRRVRQDARTRTLPVVVLTSSAEDSDILATYDLGGNSYVRKPVRMDDFARATAQLGLYWTIVNLTPTT
ncbi:MAG: response regulator [Candidatus Obscuribacterales bacterium]|nr:response regulator [Steroidobacteraceae bacterium]